MTLAIWLFAASVTAALYLLVGYPIVLRMFPFRRRPIAKDLTFQPTVSVLMAVYNGEAFLEAKLRNLLEFDYPRNYLEILVISDGSTDGTDSIVQQFHREGIQLLRVPHGGKAAALNTGMARATGEVLFFCDVRQQILPDALRQLAANFADPQVGAATGELRILKPEMETGEQANLGIYWRYELWARGVQSSIWSLYNTTGCIYAMRRSLAQPLSPGTLGDDAALPLLAYFAGYRIVFDPTAIATDYPTEEGAEFRRRMRTLSGAWQMWVRHPRLLFTSHPMWLHFVSHKLGRLLLPWLLIAIFGSSLFLPDSPWKWLILSAEVGLLVLAILDKSLPARFPGKRITSLAGTFLTMNAASLLAAQVLFVRPEKLWAAPTRVDRSSSS